MYMLILALKIGIFMGILVLYLRWRKRFTSSEKVLTGIQGFAAWAGNNREKVLRYTRLMEAAVGLFLLCLGYYIGKEHFHLIRDGARAEGTIVGYKEEYFPGSYSGASRSGFTAFMPIVKFQVGEQAVEFKDWMGTNNAVKNVRVVVLYDPENPGVAMIDRPVWNWIPWAPTLGVGLFLLFVGVRGWMASK
jgi:hypothetical protein